MVDIDIFKNMSLEIATNCSVCGRSLGKPLIELPHFPITDIYVEQQVMEKVGYVDQNFHICLVCGHGQLSTMVDLDVLYGHTYSFRTSKSLWGSTKANDLFLDFVNRTTGKCQFKTILEIGCNDLYLLNYLKDRSGKLIGIDPVLKGAEEELCDDKITVIGDYVENVDLPQLEDALILSSHLFEHLRTPGLMMETLLKKATESTIFIFQFPGLDTLVQEWRFDQIYSHHLQYFSLQSFVYLLNELGCELIDAEVNRLYWGSLLVAFRKSPGSNKNVDTKKINPEKVIKNYQLFKSRMDNTGRYIDSLAGEKLMGYGAGLQLPVLSYHLGNDLSCLECVIDDDENKNGKYYLNLPVPIRNSQGINSLEDTSVIITAMNFTRGILHKLIPLNPKRVIIPLNI